MEEHSAKWIIRGNELLDETAATSIRGYLNMLYDHLDKDDQRPVVPLSHGDPSAFACFRTSPEAVDAIVHAVQSAEFNSYAPTIGILPARRYLLRVLFQCLLYIRY
jgi:tyrosine aminotransferase